MLKPALLFKDEIEKKFAEVMYDDDYFLYMGYAHGHELPKIEPKDNIYQWAIVNRDNVVIGWLAYRVDPATDQVYNFGIYSFDRGNPIVGLDILRKLEELVTFYRRVEWRVVGGNPVVKYYDKFCKDHNGNKATFHATIKDPSGCFRDEHVYEIVK